MGTATQFTKLDITGPVNVHNTQKSLIVSLVMLVQEVPKPSTGTAKKAARGSALYGRAALDSSAQQARIARHLIELEQDNYHAVQIDIPKPESKHLL